MDLSAEFGDRALTVAHRPDFHIQALYWKDASTTIHEHGFSAALTVLSGTSVNVQYKFEVDDATTPYLITGRLKHKSGELLRAGEVREIQAGPR